MKTEFHVKLVGPTAGFTGLMFGMPEFEFKDGISVKPLHFIAAQRLAMEARGLVYLDEKGNEIGEVAAGAMPLAELSEEPVVTLRKDEEPVETGTVEVTDQKTGEQTVFGEQPRLCGETPNRHAAVEILSDTQTGKALPVVGFLIAGVPVGSGFAQQGKLLVFKHAR